MTDAVPAGVEAALRAGGAGRGELLGVAVTDGVLGLAPAGGPPVGLAVGDAAAVVRALDGALAPRWTWWDAGTAHRLVRDGTRVGTCWDVAAVHRLLAGGWRAEPGRAWAHVRGLDVRAVPQPGPPDLFALADRGDPAAPVRPDGHLHPEWVDGDWARSPDHAARWAALALDTARLQQTALAALDDRPLAASTARAESATELLCAELMVDGLPLDRAEAERLIGDLVGPRPATPAEADELRRRRDDAVLRHAPPGATADLRNPAQVKALLRRVGLEVDDTRAWRLEALRGTHPLVDALLTWRKAERVATTYGYAWLDTHVGADGRLRGAWSSADGAAGRMTASAGLHNLPADLRVAVRAEPGHRFVRADLGQIEPRVLAAISADPALVRATAEDDLYLPVATQLGVDRATAKVAVLGAMYGQTTGHGARALQRLEAAYPIAMALLHDADVAGQTGRDLRTYGGRLLRTSGGDAADADDAELRRRAGARGRYARNALVQGAAAELFKMWAVTVRARGAAIDARIVLCLHDELLVHVPTEHAPAAVDLVEGCLQEAAHRWSPGSGVRFLADVSVVERWSDAEERPGSGLG